MNELKEIWESSRINDYTYIHYGFMITCIISLFICNKISKKETRQGIKVLILFLGSFISLSTGSRNISEKWKIRTEWVKQNKDKLNEDQQKLVTYDGANLVMGPWIGAFLFFITLSISIFLSSVVYERNEKEKSLTNGSN